VAGFLWFNLRFGSQHRARVFMGDNGSMMLGLLIAWQLVAITQGDDALVPPVVALWMFAVPLIDTLAVMARRVWLGQSPFSPDRHHLHHLLQRAGFRVEHTVTIIGGLHLALGLFGLLGAWLGVPEGVMLAGFLGLFAVYVRLTARPWRFVPMLRGLHRKLHLTPARNCGVFFGNTTLQHVEQINALVAPELKDNTVFRTRLYEYRGDPEHPGRRMDTNPRAERARQDAARIKALQVSLLPAGRAFGPPAIGVQMASECGVWPKLMARWKPVALYM